MPRDVPNKPDIDTYMLQIASVVSSRSTCPRRAVGCVLTDQHGHIIGTGYNGLPRGRINCIDEPCEEAYSEAGSGLSKCQAVHAEINALIQCKSTQDISTCYTTTFPCVPCLSALMNTSCSKIVFIEHHKTGGIKIWPHKFLQIPVEVIIQNWPQYFQSPYL